MDPVVATLIESIDRYATEHIDAEKIDAERSIPSEVLTDLAELGVFSLSIPEDYGGAELGLSGACAVVAALARHDRSVATTVGLHLGLGTRGLIRYGSDALKERYLPGLAAGEPIAAFCATEPGAGSDLAAISTRARLGGGRVRVDGTKIYVTNGGFAGIYTIAADTYGADERRIGQSLLLLERGDAGVLPEGEEHKLGLRGSSTTSLHLEGVDVGEDRIIGEAGKGAEEMAHVLAWGRTAMASGCVGTAAAALAATREHTATRTQFGRTLDQFEVVQDQLADASGLLYAMEALVARCGTASEADLVLRSTAAKVVCSRGAWEVCDTAVQLHGGCGFIEETGIPLMLRDARVPRIFEGANDVLLVHSGSMDVLTPIARTALDDGGPLAARADELAALVSDVRGALYERFKLRLLRKQLLIHRLGALVVLREASDAAVLAARTGDDEAQARAARWLVRAHRRARSLTEEIEVHAGIPSRRAAP